MILCPRALPCGTMRAYPKIGCLDAGICEQPMDLPDPSRILALLSSCRQACLADGHEAAARQLQRAAKSVRQAQALISNATDEGSSAERESPEVRGAYAGGDSLPSDPLKARRYARQTFDRRRPHRTGRGIGGE